MAASSGDLVGGRYCLVELVGQGGMGRVWRSHDKTLNREVAVKEILLPDYLPTDQRNELVARAMGEAEAAARLHHPGIITVYNLVTHADVPWIVMEFVSGPSLAAIIEREGRLPWERVAEIGAELADALAHVHAVGVVHRDLKPDNVLLPERRTVMTDFGIALILDASSRWTPHGAIIGTPQYIAPERLEGRPVEAPSDLWSLGATLYAAVEGQPPFDKPTLAAVWGAILNQPLPLPRYAGPLTPVLHDLMAKDPGQRPSADEAAQHLTAIRRMHTVALTVEPRGDVPTHIPTASVQPVPAPLDSPVRVPLNPPSTEPAPGSSAIGGQKFGTMCWETSLDGWVSSSPAVSDGMVYVGIHDSNNGRSSCVYALKATTGQVCWQTLTGGAVSSWLAVSDDIVYVGSGDHHVYALDAATGRVRWSTPTGGEIKSSPAVSGEMVYINNIDGDMYALDTATGRRTRWKTRVGSNASSPVVSGRRVYICAQSGNVYALDAAPRGVRKVLRLWRTPVDQDSSGAIASSPTVSGQMVYIGCRDKHVYALNAATGGVRWKTLTGGAIQSSPTVSGGMVYINSNGDGLYVLDAATGAVSRRARGGSFNLSPAVSNGIIYNGGEKHMFALRAG